MSRAVTSMSQDDQKLFKMYCQACGAEFVFSASVAGRKARCLSCQHIFRVPTLSGTESPATPVKPAAEAPRHSAPTPVGPSRSPGEPAEPPAPRSRRRSHSVRLAPAERTPTPAASDLLGNDELLGVGAPPPAVSAAVDDPLENLASLERRSDETVETTTVTADQAISAPRTSAGQSGPLLVLEGLMYLAIIVVIVFLAYRFLGVMIASWALIPVLAVFGRRLLARVTFMMTMGTVRLP